MAAFLPRAMEPGEAGRNGAAANYKGWYGEGESVQQGHELGLLLLDLIEVALLRRLIRAPAQQPRAGHDVRARIEMKIPTELRYALVPSLFLQPLVENAIRHGLSPRAGGGTIVVTAASSNGRLEIKVADDGVGLPPGWSLQSQEGIGLSVTRERILGLHPDGYSSFVVVPRAGGGGTEVEMSFPLHLMEEERDHAEA